MIILTSKLLFHKILKGYTGITLWPFVILRQSKNEIGEEAFNNLINHERIHLRQQLECLIIFFYILYIYYYIRNRFRKMKHYEAYSKIPFEIESYVNEKNQKYLQTRKLFAWRKYR